MVNRLIDNNTILKGRLNDIGMAKVKLPLIK